MRFIMKSREVLVHFEAAFQNDEDQDIEYNNFCVSLKRSFLLEEKDMN
jgi:hypothetical protein